MIYQTGGALAADRATKFLPVIVAQTIFIAVIGVAILKIGAASKISKDNVWINIEVRSIAFSLQSLWIIPAVFLGSMIGVSQTGAAIPRILRRFQTDLERLSLPKGVNLPNDVLANDQRRVFCK